jgi:4-hydroxy-tetrahydrodipicolinate reductase
VNAPQPIAVAVIGASGRLGRCACAALEGDAGWRLVAGFSSRDDWPRRIRELAPLVALDATRAGLGFEHGRILLEAGVRPVIGTSGVTPEETAELDRLARARELGGLVVPNFSLGALLLARAAEDLARHFAKAEIVELHHDKKRDAPSGTALETARRIERARGEDRASVPIHSVRLPGLYAHQEVLFGSPGELVTLRHDMLGPEAFGPGILASLAYAAAARGVARGLERALAR